MEELVFVAMDVVTPVRCSVRYVFELFLAVKRDNYDSWLHQRLFQVENNLASDVFAGQRVQYFGGDDFQVVDGIGCST